MINASDILRAKILIVDDQNADVMLLERMLQGAGYDCVTSTTDPHKACELHLMNDFDLIILDLQMPGMDGFQVMQNLQEIETGRYLPVLVITAEPDHKSRALKAGARDFIGKPFDHAEVLIRVYNMVEIRLLRREAQQRQDSVAGQQNMRIEDTDGLRSTKVPAAILANHRQGFGQGPTDIFSELVTENYGDVSVLFVNIVDSATRTQGLQDVRMDVLERFDSIAENRSLQRIKTINGAYLATTGLPTVPLANHAVRAAHMALDIFEDIARFNAIAATTTNIRIGIGSGAVITGVIGKRKYLYGLWGDAINSAYDMESHGVVGRIQIADTTRQHLGKPFMLERRGGAEISGHATINTWFLNGRNG